MSAVLFEPYASGAGIEWLEGTFIPQSTVFYAELIPIIYRCALQARTGDRLRIADIGSAHASGANLIYNVLNNLTGVEADVAAFELQERFRPYAEAKFPNVEFNTIDFFDDARTFDIVVVSHTLEHIKGPRDFVEKVLAKVRTCAIFYVPYMERDLIPGHVTSFTEELIRSMPGFAWGRTFRSVGWRTTDDARVAAFVCVAPNLFDRHDAVLALRSALDDEMSGAPIKIRETSVPKKRSLGSRMIRIARRLRFAGLG